jgi:hypothetical protein
LIQEKKQKNSEALEQAAKQQFENTTNQFFFSEIVVSFEMLIDIELCDSI